MSYNLLPYFSSYVQMPFAYQLAGFFYDGVGVFETQLKHHAVPYCYVNTVIHEIFSRTCKAIFNLSSPIYDIKMNEEFYTKYPSEYVCLSIASIVLPIFLAKKIVNYRKDIPPLTYKGIVLLALGVMAGEVHLMKLKVQTSNL